MAHPMLAAALLLAAATAAVSPTPPPALDPPAPADARWKHLASGLELRVMDGGSPARRGSHAVAVVRIQPSRWRIEPFSHSEDPNSSPLDIEAWQKRTGAAVIFNAGQYYPDRVPMGLFIKAGHNLGSRQIKAWKALLVAEPVGQRRGQLPRAGILDLDYDEFVASTTPYRVALQSFMLFDREGKKRVRRSDWLANRTVVATDRRGRLLVLHTEGAWSLWDLADWIARSDLGARHAMAMDGGFESQLCVRTGGAQYVSYGRWHIDDRGDHSVEGLRVGLPAVIGVFPR